MNGSLRAKSKPKENNWKLSSEIQLESKGQNLENKRKMNKFYL